MAYARRMVDLVRNIFGMLTNASWLATLLVRLSVGTMFFLSGLGKVGDLAKFTKEFQELGIPFPALQAPFVAGVELIGGALLVIGLGTRLVSAALAITMIVAIITATELSTLSNFLYLSEWNLFLLLTCLGFSGSGQASIDHVIAQRVARAWPLPPTSVTR